MRTPEFWARRGMLARALAPLGLITRTITARRVARPGFIPGIPVYCVGNAIAGGAGKTILTLDLLARLPGRPFALSRGYRGRLPGPVLVDPAIHGADDVGDEPLLLAAAAPTIVARDRAAGARLALSLGASAIVMDDGLQNPTLAKTRSFLVIDGAYGFGNGLLMPAGPLREPAAVAAARCDAAIMIGEDETGAAEKLPGSLPILKARLTAFSPLELNGRRVIAFAGIGRPEKFFASAAALGAILVRTIPFPDHHRYVEADAVRLLALADVTGGQLITTAKDALKLPPSLKAATVTVGVGLTWADQEDPFGRIKRLLF